MEYEQMDPNRNRYGPKMNMVVDIVKNELKMDHHFIHSENLLFVKIDKYTLDNPVLNDW